MLAARELEVCPYCDEPAHGEVCPSCGSVFAPADKPPEPSAEATRGCPYCEAEVLPGAAVCHSCGSVLEQS